MLSTMTETTSTEFGPNADNEANITRKLDGLESDHSLCDHAAWEACSEETYWKNLD